MALQPMTSPVKQRKSKRTSYWIESTRDMGTPMEEKELRAKDGAGNRAFSFSPPAGWA
jgi:hypothetical protein